ncbi:MULTISPECIES: bifunctional acetaldehyde-CoA/alcohol dehydrogenase [unclassified Exiguobacterium]|uniref:bifunctional acetaldehyde-CoA/alcohol dehydrogenase n=1 Tax=unclassified Exiguobacterium TaxID=2644629 RepID=UPI000452262F|nr:MULTISPECIES: bifunctional acetaldehyde-CoA/alcohol dehydrogenase [unclassified Exiguobacterium]EZP61564.1 Bifunctional acetaldehyde-CoA/alcohol dehydrogenase [Exiguobacterium sp. RIT341]KQS45061.1 acetaldehyde dehydrogenase [Exiguobacterium sp. Leaf196]
MAVKEKTKSTVTPVEQSIGQIVEKGQRALQELLTFDQEKIDTIVRDMALAGLERHVELARLATEETGRGVFEDKMIKNIFATEYIYNSLRHEKTVGILEEDVQNGITYIAEPVGVVCGVTPVTNPTSTTMFKALIAIKTRNPIIFAFHPSAQRCSVEAAKTLRDAAIKAGAPKDCIQWVEEPSLEATKVLMNHENIAMVLATGGAGMVKSAYSTGKPALGVGPGNVPCYIEQSAKVKRAVSDLVLSKTFDNGMICASEQAVIVDQEIYATVRAEMEALGCYFCTPEEKQRLESLVIKTDTCAVNADIVGKPATWIAEKAGIDVPETTVMLVAELGYVGAAEPLSHEKLSPVLGAYRVASTEEAFTIAEQMLEIGGLGHTAVIHTTNDDLMTAFGLRMKACRILVNSPSAHGGIGDLYNELTPSLTLGCGSYGKNSVSENVTAKHLLNVKKVARRRVNMQWFKVPEKIYFEKNSVQYLRSMTDVSRVMIVTDPTMVQFGYADKVIQNLPQSVSYRIFDQVEPDPSVTTVQTGAQAMRDFKPDLIIALGGGSAMDAAKGMWLFYEQPNETFSNLRQKFLDIRKRAYQFPALGRQAKFVAIPTTSGTGSEVTPFTVITDKEKNVKYPIADYALTPDVAIVDPEFVMTVPASITADTGMDVLTHATEAYVSVLANDYTDGLALKAIKMIFDYLPRAYENGSDAEAREKVHNASTMAGMAFANAFLGINHSIAHKIGGEFHTPHGRTNAILMPHVIRYNASRPTKLAAFPKYESFVADERYADIARYLGLPAATTEQGVESLIQAVADLGQRLNIKMSFKAQGIQKADFEAKLDKMAVDAFEDQCTTANPKMPLVAELRTIMEQAYEGI